MVKVPSQGQPADIVRKIDEIIIEYISNENCLILAVTPANIDIVTSDALVMARSRDPMGKRTIGVLTKLDMMGKGQNAREVLQNKVVVLERGNPVPSHRGSSRHSPLGFIGVVLRGQRLDEHGRASKELDIPGALEHERQFFTNDPAYRYDSRLNPRESIARHRLNFKRHERANGCAIPTAYTQSSTDRTHSQVFTRSEEGTAGTKSRTIQRRGRIPRLVDVPKFVEHGHQGTRRVGYTSIDSQPCTSSSFSLQPGS